MSLAIETFSNVKGGDSFFKAIGHPLAKPPAEAMLARLAAAGPVAIYDPLGQANAFAAIHDLSRLQLAGAFVQGIGDLGRAIAGRSAQPVTDLPASGARAVLVTAFDAERLVGHIRHLLPAGAIVETLDGLKLPEAMLTNKRAYLDPLNFATNFAFFRDAGGVHTRVVTANYWSGYGAKDTRLWLRLFDEEGATLAEWTEPVEADAAVILDSRAVRRRFGLGEFTGQLFIHVLGTAGHDVVKYALDVFGARAEDLSCTHDANAWPADLYAGLPAPQAGERVVLWVQNSHPCAIPAGGIGLSLMGSGDVARLDRPIAPFASYPLDVASLLPKARWPQQIEIHAGRHFVRPRYEITTAKRRRIAHPNVERIDLEPDPRIPELANLMGKGYVLPAPVLPPDGFRSLIVPTPMATTQVELPLAVRLYDGDGREVANRFLGRLPRSTERAIDVAELFDGAWPSGYGHLELTYDFRDGGGADGWLHGLFRYEDKRSGHAAETSFGAHMFNTVLTYKGEPQSYAGRAPGLSTRLFLRLGHDGLDALCHLIYPVSTTWHPRSETTLSLRDGQGREIAREEIRIAMSGSLLWRAREMFGAKAIERAGEGGHVIIRDTTCRLFGYHGLVDGERSFSLDHMFGF